MNTVAKWSTNILIKHSMSELFAIYFLLHHIRPNQANHCSAFTIMPPLILCHLYLSNWKYFDGRIIDSISVFVHNVSEINCSYYELSETDSVYITHVQ